MKKGKLINFGTALLIAGIFGACSKEQKVVSNLDNIAQQLKFVSVNERIKEKTLSNSRDKIIIVQWTEWGRASKDCRGWGICNADWFPQFNSMVLNPNPGNGGASILEIDQSKNKYYFDILLAASPPASISLVNLPLTVDEEIVLNTKTDIGTDLKINQGRYYYDSTIGTFGGFRIYLDNL